MKVCEIKPFTGIPKIFPAKTFDVPSNPPVNKSLSSTYYYYILHNLM